MAKGGWVYIMANRYRGGMYVGVTADALARVYQHREGTGSRHVADFGVGVVEESVKGGVIHAMPVPRHIAAVGMGVKEILRRFDDDVGVGVEDNVFEVAEVEFANDAVAAIFLFPNPSVKEDFIFARQRLLRLQQIAPVYPHQMRIFPG